MLIRSISGAVFVAIVVSSIFLSPWMFGVLFFCFVIIGSFELIKSSKSVSHISINKPLAYLFSAMVYIVLLIGSVYGFYLWMYGLLLLLPISFLAELYRKKDLPFVNVAYTLLPALYIALPMGLLNFLSNVGEGKFLFAFFITIWAGDTFAYLVGSLIGKHRLFERISPKKSWEGTIGAFVLTIGLSLFYPSLFGVLLIWQWMIFASIAFIAGAFGDLVESLFKRSMSIKDSGSIMPGHGGVLDRFDAVILASPFIFVFLQIIST